MKENENTSSNVNNNSFTKKFCNENGIIAYITFKENIIFVFGDKEDKEVKQEITKYVQQSKDKYDVINVLSSKNITVENITLKKQDKKNEF